MKRLLLVLVLLSLPCWGQAVTVIQSKTCTDLGGGGTASCALNSPITTGNALIVVEEAFLDFDPTDSLGQTYVHDAHCTNAFQAHPFVNIYHVLNSGASPTVSGNDGFAWARLTLFELHNVNASTPLDGTAVCGASDYAANPTAVGSGNIITTQTDVLVAGLGQKDPGNTGCVWTTGSGWTLETSSDNQGLTEYQASASGTYNGNGSVTGCSFTSAEWTAGVVAYQPAGAPSGGATITGTAKITGAAVVK